MTTRKSLADNMTLPSVESYDKDVLLATIIRNYSSLPALYEDPEYFYEEVDFWWRSHKNNYAKIFLVMESEYNPLENYNRIEERHTQSDNSKTTNDTSSSTTDGTMSGSSTSNTTTSNEGSSNGTNTAVVDSTVGVDGSNTSETKVSAQNSSTYHPKTMVEDTSGSTTDTDSTTTITDNVTNSNSGSTNATSSDTNRSNSTFNGQTNGTEISNNTMTETSNHRGNIGVTTSQQMLIDELKVRKISPYSLIAEQFADEMLLSIW